MLSHWKSLVLPKTLTQPIIQNVLSRPMSSFFDSKSSTELWKSVTMVSNQGKMRGRSKGLLRMKNLNRGQELGVGKAKLIFPGLNRSERDKPSKAVQKIEKMDEGKYEEYTDKILNIRKEVKVIGRKRQSPL